MKKIYTIILIALLSINCFSQAPSWVWAKSAGGSDSDYGKGIAVDGSGNSYVTGSFRISSITFGSITLTNAGNSDIFIVKYDASGNVVWAKSAGGAGDDSGQGIAVDSSGNSYVTGYFRSSSITFGSITLTNANTGGSTEDMFIVKYDAGGNVVWANSAGGSSNDGGQGIAVDGSGNSYVTGYFNSLSITFGSITLTNTGSDDMFIVKYDAGGNVVWANSAGGSSIDDGQGIAVDSNGNSYVTGLFLSSSITFGSITLTSAGGRDMFIVKYDAGGNVVWANSAGGSGDDYAQGIVTDSSGNSYVTGYFRSSSITFGSITLTNTGINNNDMFIVKYDAGGNVVWANLAGGGSNDDEGQGIAVDGSGNSYVTGYFNSSSITFGSITLTNAGGNPNIFIVKYDAGGNVVWAKSAGGNQDDEGQGIAVDGSGNPYITGHFRSSSITFGNITLTNVNINSYDMFIAKLDTASIATSISKLSKDNESLTIYPNPFTSQTTISFSEEQKNTSIKITDLVGKQIKTINFTGRQLVIDKAEMKAGTYFVQTTDEQKHICNKKIIIQ